MGSHFTIKYLILNGNYVVSRLQLPHYGPGVDSASNKNEYQEYFLGVKTAGA
jgi:hypothetical protein